MSEPITGELRRRMDTLGWYDEDGSIVITTGDSPVSEMACLVINSKTFGELCDAIDSIHANLERENESLRREFDRELGEMDDVHKTDGISDNSGSFMHNEKRSIGSAAVTITDELRKVAAKTECANGRCEKLYRGDLDNIADRIDAEHEALRDQLDTSERQKESYREDLLAANRQVHASYNDGFDDGFASADDWLSQHEDAMAEHGWVRLPLDADDVPIHVGDVMDGYSKTIEVVELRYGRSGWVLISRDGNGYADTFAFTHHHADSWERIIKDALTMPIHSKTDVAQFVARCKALAGDAE